MCHLPVHEIRTSGLILHFTARALCAKFEKATDMKDCADNYYAKISGCISATKRQTWENEMIAAEEQRLTDRKAMDILKARSIPVSPAVPQPSTRTGTTVHPEATMENWIQMGLDLEEKQ